MVASFLSLTSCIITDEDLISTDLPVAVLNSIITPGKRIKIRLLQSVPYVNTVDPLLYRAISGATMKLFEDGVLVETLTSNSSGYYTFNYSPSEGKKYLLKVKTLEGKQLSTSTYIPFPVKLKLFNPPKKISYGQEKAVAVDTSISNNEVDEYALYLRSRYFYCWEYYDSIGCNETLPSPRGYQYPYYRASVYSAECGIRYFLSDRWR